MAVTLYASGTQTATGASEDVLSSPNVAGRFQLVLDLNAMAANDVLEVYGYKMAIASGTSRKIFLQSFQGVRPSDQLVVFSDPIPNTLTDTAAVKFSLNQTFGTGRAYPWAVMNLEDTSSVRKNTALAKFMFLLTDSTNHAPATGKTVSVTRSIDGGAFGAGTLSAVTEVSNGMYYVDFAAADLNGTVIVLRATATGCDDTFERIVTAP